MKTIIGLLFLITALAAFVAAFTIPFWGFELGISSTFAACITFFLWLIVTPFCASLGSALLETSTVKPLQ